MKKYVHIKNKSALRIHPLDPLKTGLASATLWVELTRGPRGERFNSPKWGSSGSLWAVETRVGGLSHSDVSPTESVEMRV